MAKAIAIFMVVYGHLYYRLTGNSTVLISFCHMPVFFFISGYFLEKSVEKYTFREILFKKTKGLLVPYLVWSMISLAVNCTMKFLQGDLGGVGGVFTEGIDIFLYSRSVWFLIELYVSSLLFIFFKYVALKCRVNSWLVCVSGWLMLSVVLPGEFLAFYKFKWLYPFLLIGAFSERKQYRLFRGSRKLFFLVAFVFVLLSLFTYEKFLFEAYSSFSYDSFKEVCAGVFYYMVSLLGIFAVCSLTALVKGRLAECLGYIGRYSMDIYVTHMFFIKLHFWTVPYGKIFAGIYSVFVTIITIAAVLFLREKLLKYFRIYEASAGRW